MVDNARHGRDSDQDHARIAEVFGDVLPDTTSDERAAWGEPAGERDDAERWYRENRPPHHDS